jgi:hypothetical protein
MADYIPITEAQSNPEAPVDSSLIKRLRDNPVAIAGGTTGAPRVRGSARSLNLIGTATVSSTVTEVTITDLPFHFGIVIEGVGITFSGSEGFTVLISGDNGSTFSSSVFNFATSAGTGQRNGGQIIAWPLGVAGLGGFNSAGSVSTSGRAHSLPNGINAVRWRLFSTNLSAGTFNVYADIREYE